MPTIESEEGYAKKNLIGALFGVLFAAISISTLAILIITDAKIIQWVYAFTFTIAIIIIMNKAYNFQKLENVDYPKVYDYLVYVFCVLIICWLLVFKLLNISYIELWLIFGLSTSAGIYSLAYWKKFRLN